MDELLLRELTPAVIGVLVHRGVDFATAEDAVQEALIQAALTWPDRQPADPKGWLVTVAWRKFLDARRCEVSRRDREQRVEAEPPPGPTETADDTCPRTHAAGGSRSSISVRRCSNPASVSRVASSLAAAAEVAAVAPGQRGWDTKAMRPPGRNSRASSRSRTVGSGHMPTVLTASAALNGPSLMDRLSTGV